MLRYHAVVKPSLHLTTFTFALVCFAPALPTPPAALGQPVPPQELDRIETQTINLRQLAKLAPFETRFVNRSEARGKMEEIVLRNQTPEEVEAYQYRSELLGYVEPGADLLSLWLDAMGTQWGTFYDQRERVLNVVLDGDRLGASDILYLAVGVTYALQDQHFNVQARQEAMRGENDQWLAYQAVFVGDAVLLLYEYARTYFTTDQLRELVQQPSAAPTGSIVAPLIIQREDRFPAAEGLEFVRDHYSRGGWAAVNALYRDAPVSTAQILHPEKYMADGPVSLPMPDLGSVLGPTWRYLEETTLGELDLQILIEQYVDVPTAERAAAGWNGDRFQLYHRDRDGALFLGLRTAWDSEADAVEFFAAYQNVATGRHGAELTRRPDPEIGTGPPPDATWAAQAGQWHHAMIRDASQVALVISTDGDAVTALAALR